MSENEQQKSSEELVKLGNKAYNEDEDFALGYKYYKEAADLGNTTAMMNIGYIYEDSKFMPRSYKKAFDWFKKAAECGNVVAMRRVADSYKRGILDGDTCVLDKNNKKAIEWYQKAAETGSIRSMWYLSRIYEKGYLDLNRDREKALEWYNKAFNKAIRDVTDTGDINYIASEYLEHAEREEAIKWYEKSAEANIVGDKPLEDSIWAMRVMATQIYYNENSVMKDYSKALYWFKRIISINTKYCGDIMNWIGKIYEIGGSGVKKDYEQAREWYQKAIGVGDKNAKNNLKDLEEKMNRKDNGGCFITTAVCSSFGKSDDCYELMKFREFRDEWLMKEADGKELISEYYRIAPMILTNIEKMANASEIYKLIWEEYLKPCLSFIELRKNQDSKQCYIKMVTVLKQRFLQ